MCILDSRAKPTAPVHAGIPASAAFAAFSALAAASSWRPSKVHVRSTSRAKKVRPGSGIWSVPIVESSRKICTKSYKSYMS